MVDESEKKNRRGVNTTNHLPDLVKILGENEEVEEPINIK